MQVFIDRKRKINHEKKKNTMENKKFWTENASIQYLINDLRNRGYKDIKATQITNKFEHYDVSATHPLGYKYHMEVKRRYFNSWKYGDAIIEKSKYDKFVKEKEEGIIDGAWVVTMFLDKWTISNALNPTYFSEEEAKKTTEFENNEYVTKTFAHYNFNLIYDY